MISNPDIESINMDKYKFITMFEMVLPERFTMLDFFLENRRDFGQILAANEMLFHKKNGVPPIPSWYKKKLPFAIYLFKYRRQCYRSDLRKFAESIDCFCGGDFGLALLWLAAKNKIPKWDFIMSPYETEEIEEKSCPPSIIFGSGLGWKFFYEEKLSDSESLINGENYFICFQKI